MTTGERMKLRRKELGMNAETVAKLLSVSPATIYRYENGSIEKMGVDKLAPIAQVLLTTPAYLMGWEEESMQLNPPTVTEDVVSFPVLGSVAAGYKHIVDGSNWHGESVTIPREFLHGRPESDYFVLSVEGESMYPLYMDGDIVLVLRQSTLNRSGEIGVVVYDDDKATIKKVEYVMGEDWFKMIPVNPQFPPVLVEGERLEHCRVLGIPKLLIRRIED